MQTESYAGRSRVLLAQAREELDRGDHIQASEKLWGAAAQMVKAIAERRGRRHDSHARLFETVNELVRETGDTTLRDLFQVANSLHTNFYENWQPREFVEQSVGRVEEFVSKLGALDGEPSEVGSSGRP